MRQADLYSATMRSASSNLQATASTPPARAIASTAPAAPSAPAAGNNSFASLFGEVRTDVNDFIQHGSSETGSAALSTLSAEGQVYRERLQTTLSADNTAGDESQQQFLASIAPWAQQAGERLGVSADLVAAHAALESGWGRHPLRQADGGDTNNLFALKAAGNWRGGIAQSLTTEYEGGNALKKTEAFRSYPDQASAFKDYAQLLLNNPRYRSALNTGSDAHAFAQGLARGGYATDPAYAGKLARIADQIQAGRVATQHDATVAKTNQSGD
ncbi:hypothetical protein GCM10011396_22280 [Undibacterium terreum]|uniref:Mannosyl-glycoprotein endo-beta-N-acetylglucosamidase-like domain-containing protein n=2 Tax=Undibacterium terreum TaxID=1224302 RepID=A0A916UIU0_9BURK|nr:hypothetical protein GCM10011396_22280 [Undibacterium terreum]